MLEASVCLDIVLTKPPATPLTLHLFLYLLTRVSKICVVLSG